MILEWALFFVFPALMIFAGAYDLFTMTIPNKICLALVAGFVCLAPFAGLGWETIGYHVAVGAGVLALSIAMFAMNWIGGGDAKLFAAASLWIGFEQLLAYAVYASILGGVLTIGFVVLRTFPLPGMLLKYDWLARLHDSKSGIPYGIALAAAGLLVYPKTIWMSGIGA